MNTLIPALASRGCLVILWYEWGWRVKETLLGLIDTSNAGSVYILSPTYNLGKLGQIANCITSLSLGFLLGKTNEQKVWCTVFVNAYS